MAEPTIGELFALKPVKPYTNSKVLPQPNPAPGLLYGIELEIENASFDWDNSFFSAKEDGSLRNRGVEFVSQPTTYSIVMHKLREFFNAHPLAYIKHPDGESADHSNYSERTSNHVHTNCQNLTLSELATICMLYEVFERPLFNFIGHGRDKNIFCVPWSETTLSYEIIDKFRNKDTSHLKRWQKYTALNLHRLTDLGTIEWRHMHGNNDINFIGTWLRLIGHFYRIATSMPFDDVVNRIISLNSTSEYQQVGEWLFQDDVKYLQSPTYDMDVEDGVLNMKYAFTSNKNKKAEVTNNWPQVLAEVQHVDLLGAAAGRFNWDNVGQRDPVQDFPAVADLEQRVRRERREQRLREAMDRINRQQVNNRTPEVAE